jgi:lipopolysaccharide transport system ATP-binding protein
LTGRENIYLNGAILGMKRAEIARKFDAIVAFSEVEQFIDTPVKHYSSGMYLRLAFAVAAHMDPEILIVDEVLAVGDASFQKKCLNKMQDVGQEGRTVLFVSHSMPAITRLCERAILLDGGRVVQDGPSGDVVGAYLKSGFGTTALREWREDEEWPGRDIAGLHAVRVRDEHGTIREALDIRRPVLIEMEIEVWKGDRFLMPYFVLTNEEGIVAFTSNEMDPEWRGRRRPLGRYISTMEIPGNYLAEGTMFVTAGLTTLHPDQKQFVERDVVAFQVVDSLDGDSARGESAKGVRGVVRPLLKWTTVSSPLVESAELAPRDGR